MPGAKNAPKLWPATPTHLIFMVSAGSPADPYFREISALSIAPIVRLQFRVGMVISTGVFSSIDFRAFSMSIGSRDFEKSWDCFDVQRNAPPGGNIGTVRIFEKSSPLAFQCETASFTSSISTLPTISSMVRKPSCAMISRTSCAINFMKLTTCSGLPENFFRSAGSWVATPTGHVFK